MVKRYFFSLLAVLCCVSVTHAQRLAILSDIHVTPGNANDSALRAVVDEINISDVRAVIVSGDLTNEGSDEQLVYVKSILDGLKKPYYAIPGNHENNWSQSACQTFARLWGADRFCFIVDDLIVVGTNCGPFMKMGDGHVNPNDLTWLYRTLAYHNRTGRRVLSINHYPLLDDMDNYVEYENVLYDFPVIAHQHGHFHKWMQYRSGSGLESVGVRALDMKDGAGHGYTLMNVTADTIYVYNKVLNVEPELKYAIPVTKERLQCGRFSPPKDEKNRRFVIRRLADESLTESRGTSIFTRLATDDKNIYYGTSTGEVVALDVVGNALWRRSLDCGMLFSRVACCGDCLVVPTGDNRLVWLNAADGTTLWEHLSDGPYVADGLVVDGILYQGGYKRFEAWDVAKHELLWAFTDIDNYCQGAPVVDGDDIVFGAWDGYLRCLDRTTGTLRWRWSNGKPNQHLLSPGNVVPVVTEDKVFVVAPDRRATCLNRTTGSEIWRHFDPDIKVRESLGGSADGKRVYAKTMDGTLVAFDATADDYRQLWNTDCGFGYEHAPCVVLEHDGFVYTASRRGRLAIIDSATGECLQTATLGFSEVNGLEPVPGGRGVICSLIEGTAFLITSAER